MYATHTTTSKNGKTKKLHWKRTIPTRFQHTNTVFFLFYGFAFHSFIHRCWAIVLLFPNDWLCKVLLLVCSFVLLFAFAQHRQIGTQIRLSRKQRYPVCCFLVFSSVHWIGTVQTYCGVFLKIQIIKQRMICNKREYTVNIPYTMSIRWRMWEIAYIWMRRQTAEKTTTK